MPSIVDWERVDLTILNNLPERLDDEQFALVKHIASLPVPALPPADEEFFIQSMRTMTLLPSRADDDLTGELRVALYRKHFGHYPKAALSFLVERATLTCKWFPTPAECKAILNQWQRKDRPSRASAAARLAAAKEAQHRFADVMERFTLGQVTQEEADALPDQWRRIAVERGHLRADTMALRVKGESNKEGESPKDDPDQPGEGGQKAPEPHERTTT